MPPEQESKERIRRKLTKRRKPQRYSSVQYPERLKEGEDAQEDVTATKGQPAQFANQSVFSMIAAASSKTDFHSRFDDESSDSGEEPHTRPPVVEKRIPSTSPQEHHLDQHDDAIETAAQNRHEHKSHEHGILRSLPKLSLRTIKEKNYMSQSEMPLSSEHPSSTGSSKRVTPRDAPVMSRMLEAEAQLDTSTELTAPKRKSLKDLEETYSRGGKSSLAKRLKEIFSFVIEEEVISGVLRKATISSSPLMIC